MGFAMYSALCLLFCLSATSAQLLQGIVKMQGPSNYVTGNLTLSQNDKGPVTIYGRISGLTPGLHGFHIHEKGDITGGCGSTGSHYNPYKKQHGNIKDADRHLGDLGNIEADSSGIATISIQDSLISLTGPNAIVGRSLVVHADADDLGKGRGESLQNGNAGARVACGVIGILSPVERWPSNSASSLIGASSILLSVLAFFLTKY